MDTFKMIVGLTVMAMAGIVSLALLMLAIASPAILIVWLIINALT
jgi:hypothetical protein